MPKLIFSDGTDRKVDYNTAAKVLAVLEGREKPENKKQATFVATVANVEFDAPGRPQPATAAPFRHVEREHDEEIDKILADPKLKGRDRAAAVAKRIKERV